MYFSLETKPAIMVSKCKDNWQQLTIEIKTFKKNLLRQQLLVFFILVVIAKAKTAAANISICKYLFVCFFKL